MLFDMTRPINGIGLVSIGLEETTSTLKTSVNKVPCNTETCPAMQGGRDVEGSAGIAKRTSGIVGLAWTIRSRDISNMMFYQSGVGSVQAPAQL
ncbi:hypothetical protein PoB_003586400 [Plakobranchus ocellatus]|uniref:Uncharacterized protein n=1 Tax=Plakobranchus ocellatus TaxID=259542 RepID=A0AAV4ATA7_9GAST|nr:hypothetical protein PoB_003586400 [Plakobranchus ocellatus]